MLIVSYFHRIYGPRIFLTNPRNFDQSLSKERLNQVQSLMDSTDYGFFTHYFSPEFKTANNLFLLNSSWARGRTELVMITVIISEEEPDYSMYEKVLSEFVDKLQAMPELFKAFYRDAGTKDEDLNIKRSLMLLEVELENVHKILSIKKIETDGQLISYDVLKEQKEIRLTTDVVEKIGKLTTGKKNCFIVSRTQGSIMKLDIIPVATEKIVRLAIIFGETLQLPVLHQIGQTLARYENKASLVFTSGVCQEVDRCVYEVYLDTDMETLNIIIQDFYTIESIISIEVKLIALNP